MRRRRLTIVGLSVDLVHTEGWSCLCFRGVWQHLLAPRLGVSREPPFVEAGAGNFTLLCVVSPAFMEAAECVAGFHCFVGKGDGFGLLGPALMLTPTL